MSGGNNRRHGRRRNAPAAYGGSYNGTYDGSLDSSYDSSYDGNNTPSAFSSDTTSMTGDSSLLSAYEGESSAVTAPAETETQMWQQEEEQRESNNRTHIRDHLSLPPFVVNGEPLYDAHELPPSEPARLIRAADFQRQAEEARLAYNGDPARTWSRDPRSRYPESINHNKFGIPPPVLAHPVVAGSGSYLTGPPGPSRAWLNANDSASAQFVYHNAEEGRRQHRRDQERDMQIEQNHTERLAQLRKQLDDTDDPAVQRSLKKKISETEDKRDKARQRIAAPFDNRMPFTSAVYIPPDPQCAPLVRELASPHTHQYDQEQGHDVLPCRWCGGHAVVNSEGVVVHRCKCMSESRQ